MKTAPELPVIHTIRRQKVVIDVDVAKLIERLQPLLDAPEVDDEPKPKIGFHPGNR